MQNPQVVSIFQAFLPASNKSTKRIRSTIVNMAFPAPLVQPCPGPAFFAEKPSREVVRCWPNPNQNNGEYQQTRRYST
jgi:hypothetical protein